MQKTALIIEDESIQQIISSNLLRELGFYPIITDCLKEADRIINYIKIDLAVTDIYLPEKSGWSFIKKLRKFHKSTKVLVVTGAIDREFIEITKHNEDFNNTNIKLLLKPVNRRLFQETVLSLCGSIFSEKELKEQMLTDWLNKITVKHSITHSECQAFILKNLDGFTKTLTNCSKLISTAQVDLLIDLAIALCADEIVSYLGNDGNCKSTVESLLHIYQEAANRIAFV